MYCRNCYKIISEDTIICPHCGENLTQKKKKKINLVIIVLLCVCIAIFTHKKKVPEDLMVQTTMPNIIPTEKSFEAPPVVYGLEETVLKNGLSITWNNVYSHAGKKAPDGNVYVILEFSVENGTNDHVYVNALDFYTYFDDCSVESDSDAELFAMENDMQLLSGYLAPGKKRTGIIAYKAPKYWERVEIYYSPDFFETSAVMFGNTFHIYG